MNKDQVKGRVKEVDGSIKKNIGQAIGNQKLQAKGTIEQAQGKIQKNVGDIKHKIGKMIDKG